MFYDLNHYDKKGNQYINIYTILPTYIILFYKFLYDNRVLSNHENNYTITFLHSPLLNKYQYFSIFSIFNNHQNYKLINLTKLIFFYSPINYEHIHNEVYHEYY